MMSVKLIVAYENKKWDEKVVEIPDGTIPEKYHRGSVKWNKAAVKFAEENGDLGDKRVYVGVLDANPEAA